MQNRQLKGRTEWGQEAGSVSSYTRQCLHHAEGRFLHRGAVLSRDRNDREQTDRQRQIKAYVQSSGRDVAVRGTRSCDESQP